MRVNWKRLIISAVIVVLSAAGFGYSVYLGQTNIVKGQKEQINSLESQIDTLAKQITEKIEEKKAKEAAEKVAAEAAARAEEEAAAAASNNKPSSGASSSPAPEQPAQPTLIFYFFDPDCGTCKAQSPIVNQLVAEGIPFVFMNVDEHPEYISEYGLTHVPTFLCNGHKQAAYFTKDELRNFYNTHK